MATVEKRALPEGGPTMHNIHEEGPAAKRIKPASPPQATTIPTPTALSNSETTNSAGRPPLTPPESSESTTLPAKKFRGPYPILERNSEGLYLPPKLTASEILVARDHLRKLTIPEYLEDVIPDEACGNDILYLIFLLGEHCVAVNEDVNDPKNLQSLILEFKKVINSVLKTRPKLPSLKHPHQVAELIKKSSNIIVVSGAGISTSLGIPDFRSDKGLYAELKRHLGPNADPTSVFTLDVFKRDPALFYSVAEKVLPPKNIYTPFHAFIKKLSDEGKLLRNYTQNIDAVEDNAGIPASKIIRCHGSFHKAFCETPTCDYSVEGSTIFPNIREKKVAYCPKCASKREDKLKKPNNPFGASFGVMRPGITFFGEDLPSEYHAQNPADVRKCDLLIIAGTSLKVPPVSHIVDEVAPDVPKILVNMDTIPHAEFDINLLGYSDDAAFYLAKTLGWELNHESYSVRKNNKTLLREEGSNRGLFKLKELSENGGQSDEPRTDTTETTDGDNRDPPINSTTPSTTGESNISKI